MISLFSGLLLSLTAHAQEIGINGQPLIPQQQVPGAIAYQPVAAPGVQYVNPVALPQDQVMDQTNGQPNNFLPVAPQGNFEAYDTAYLASLNGRLPEWRPSFPVVGNGYLVPILVDEEEESNLDPAYQWVDPAAQPIYWNYDAGAYGAPAGYAEPAAAEEAQQ